MNFNIVLSKVKKVDGAALKATFVAAVQEFGGSEIDCLFFRKNDGNSWVGFCCKEYTNREGQKKLWNMFRPSKAISEDLQRSIKNAYESFEKNEAADPGWDCPF